jgi:hypothetical protein
MDMTLVLQMPMTKCHEGMIPWQNIMKDAIKSNLPKQAAFHWKENVTS